MLRHSDAEPDRLDAEIAGFEQTLLHTTDISEREPLLNILAIRLRTRSAMNANRSDLERAVRVAREAVAQQASPQWAVASYFNTLGNCLCDLFEHTGSSDELDAAIEAYRQAVRGAEGNADEAPFTANLAGALADRYGRDGTAADLNLAIEKVDRIWTAGMADPAEQAALAANYASLLLARYAATGSLDDLDRAVDIPRAALPSAPLGTPTRTTLRTNLGGALQSRYDRKRDPDDLSAALQELTAGLREGTVEPANRARLLNNIGIAFAARAESTIGTQRRDAMDRSISAHRGAVRAANTVDRPRYLNGLAAALSVRGQRLGRATDLWSSVRIWRRLAAETTLQNPLRARRLGNLGRGLALKFDRHPRANTLASAQRFYRMSCLSGLDTDPESTLSVGADWARWAMRRNAPADAAEAYELAMLALEGLFRTQLLRSYKRIWLSAATEIASGAALAMARSQNEAAAALALERGRARLLSEALQRDHAELSNLKRLDRGDLIARYRNAAAALVAIEQRHREGRR